MIRTFQALVHVEPGFTAPAEVGTFHVHFPPEMIKVPEGLVRLDRAILDNIAAIPGVSSADFSGAVPMDAGARVIPSREGSHAAGAASSGAQELLGFARLFQNHGHPDGRRPRFDLGRHHEQAPRSYRVRESHAGVLAESVGCTGKRNWRKPQRMAADCGRCRERPR